MPRFLVLLLGVLALLSTLLGVALLIHRRRERGSLKCADCGYNLTGTFGIIDKCPECGAGIIADPIDAEKRGRSRITIAAVVCIVWPYVVCLGLLSPSLLPSPNPRPLLPQPTASSSTLPDLEDPELVEFLQRFRDPTAEWRDVFNAIMISASDANRPEFWDGIGVFVHADRGDGSEGIIVAFNPASPSDRSYMQLVVAFMEPGASVPLEGFPQVRCDLTAGQARYSIRNGIPPSLVDDMCRVAKERSSSPSSVRADAWLRRVVRVDPDGHFPAETSKE